jgi:hypothetical protein
MNIPLTSIFQGIINEDQQKLFDSPRITSDLSRQVLVDSIGILDIFKLSLVYEASVSVIY